MEPMPTLTTQREYKHSLFVLTTPYKVNNVAIKLTFRASEECQSVLSISVQSGNQTVYILSDYIERNIDKK